MRAAEKTRKVAEKIGFAILTSVVISACATKPIPDGYSGPIAKIKDSAMMETGSRSQFFYLGEIDGNRVDNVLSASRAANYGRGFSLTPRPFSRDVPAQSLNLTLRATVEYGAPIQAILNSKTMYSASRKITFTPEPNKTYVIGGQLSAEQQEVWLEDAETGRRID